MNHARRLFPVTLILVGVAGMLAAPAVECAAVGCSTLTDTQAAVLQLAGTGSYCSTDTVPCPYGTIVNTCPTAPDGLSCLFQPNASVCFTCSAPGNKTICKPYPYPLCNANSSGVTPCGFGKVPGCQWQASTALCSCAPMPPAFSGDCPKSNCN